MTPPSRSRGNGKEFMSLDRPNLLPSSEPDSEPGTVECFNDVEDSRDEIARYASLPLPACIEIQAAFKRCDDSALAYQKKHGRLVFHTAFWGTWAVVLATVGLSFAGKLSHKGQLALLFVEVVTAFCAGGAAFLGHRREYKEQWLLRRHQAELLRLLKYNFLLRPALWRAVSSEAMQIWIKGKIGEIEAMKGRSGLQRAVTQPSPHGPFEGVHSRLSRREIGDLVQYYLEKRLGPQKEYLANRAQRNEFKDRVRVWLPRFFLVSILAVFIKVILELPALVGEVIKRDSAPGAAVERLIEAFEQPWAVSLFHRSELVAIYGFATIAALLPAVAAGIRLRLSAGEFSRNKSRFEAAHRALAKIEESVLRDTLAAVGAAPQPQDPGSSQLHALRGEEFLTGSSVAQIRVRTPDAGDGDLYDADVDAYCVLRDLSWCEHVLDAEHREWLRLMVDAEWFG